MSDSTSSWTDVASHRGHFRRGRIDVSGHRGHPRGGVAMVVRQMVVDAVPLEGRSVREVAAAFERAAFVISHRAEN